MYIIKLNICYLITYILLKPNVFYLNTLNILKDF